MTEVVSSLIGKVVDYLCGVAKTEITYMWNCSKNVENLTNEVEKLSSMKGRVRQLVDLAKSKGERLLEGVEEWMKKADVEISDATKFIAEEAEAKKTCFNLRLCVNLSTLHHYSKLATRKASFLRQHQEDGKDFETCVSLPAPTLGFADLYQRKNLENMDTQKSTLKMIIEAIEDDKIQIVGINGLGGVGKTTLASEVAKEMKKQFADIVFITVSQTVDAKMIHEKVQVAASKIIDGEKVLIILDDIWEELKLDEVGIPCGSEHMNCKILLTSRNKDVCEAMNVQKNISVNPLKDEEAWTLFERVVGKSEWDDSLKKVALKIVKECGGLPLFIQAVGKALKNKENKIWEVTLGRLQDPTDEDVPFKRKGIIQLKLSYDFLESVVAKSCFLLCSMFPEDRIIDLERLAYYGLALGIFNDLDSIHDIKDRVQITVESLKSSFLLLPQEKSDDEGQEEFKMHDLVRDMALFITSKDNDKFLVQSGKRLTEWKPRADIIKSYKKISLMENKICELPHYELLFPHLDTFLIQNNKLSIVPEEFFRGMEKLKVLDMSDNYVSSLPQSLKQLTQLRTLDLSGNLSVREISIIGELKFLEILRLRSTGITSIPQEIGQLTNLRLLDAYSCKYLSYVTPHVISMLIRLEALYVELNEGNCDFLVELSELKLKILHLRLPELHSIPNIQTLIEFDIQKIDEFETSNRRCKRSLQFSESSFPFEMPIMKLVQASEVLQLLRIRSLKNILPDLYPERFDELKYIRLLLCDNVTSLVDTCDLDAMRNFVTSNELGQRRFFSQVKEIVLGGLNSLELLWNRPHQYISFCNLVSISIEGCASLLKLFPISVAQGLVNLRDLFISECESLTVIISEGDEQTAGSETQKTSGISEIEFALTRISLVKLQKLESFYSGHHTIKYPSLGAIRVIHCPNMKRWSYGDNHIPNMHFDHQGRSYSNINDYIALQHEMNGNFLIPEDFVTPYDYCVIS